MAAASMCGKLEKIGFFHFTHEYSDPVSALAKAIGKEQENRNDIGNSLVVLPEAFNCGNYNSAAELLPAQEILERLRCDLAGPLRINFVVGILEPYRDCLGRVGRRNSAYWVDANGQQPMCHKMGDDGKNLYDPCTRNCDPHNPITCADARVGALICMDATTDATDRRSAPIQQRRHSLLTHLKEGEGHKIICVPARCTSTRPDPTNLRSIIPDLWYVVADGVPNGHSRVFRAPGAGSSPISVTEPAPGAGNTVKLTPLSMTG